MGATRRQSRINKDKGDTVPHEKGAKEHLGEEVALGKGRGDDARRLRSEIEDNAYVEDLEIEIIDDPKYWGGDLKVMFAEARKTKYETLLKKYIKIIKHSYKWLLQSESGQKVTNIVRLRSEIGLTKHAWDRAVEDSEEFAYYSSLIFDIIGARLHDLGVYSQGNQVFKIFSMKSHLPEEFSDKKEVNKTERIEVIQISQGNSEDIKKAIDEGKKRLK